MNHLKTLDGLARLVWLCATYETRRIVTLAERKYGAENVETNIHDTDYKNFFKNLLFKNNSVIVCDFQSRCFNGFSKKAEFHTKYHRDMVTGMKMPIELFSKVYDDVRQNIVDKKIILLMAKDFNKLIFDIRCSLDIIVPDVESFMPVDRRIFSNEQFVYIHYPEVTVTSNENEKLSVDLKDYFLRFNTTNGLIASTSMTCMYHQIGLYGTKSTYTKSQIASRYVHSHRPRLEGNNEHAVNSYLLFKAQCVGEDSPIVDYVHSVERSFNIGDVNGWTVIPDAYIRMWFSHIDNYISVESSLGGPYMYMTEINNSFGGSEYLENAQAFVNRFHCNLNQNIKNDIGVTLEDIFDENQKHGFIKFYSNGNFIDIANSESDIVLHITNLYHLAAKRLGVTPKNCSYRVSFDKTMNKLITSYGDSDISSLLSRVESSTSYILFKGNKYKLSVYDNNDDKSIKVLHPSIYAALKYGILQMVNKFVA